jgi:hypothetical protein
MLDVSNLPIFAENSLKKPFFGKIPKKWKKSNQKNIFLLNQVGIFRL